MSAYNPYAFWQPWMQGFTFADLTLIEHDKRYAQTPEELLEISDQGSALVATLCDADGRVRARNEPAPS